MGHTLKQLIESYRGDPDSPFQTLSYQVRAQQDRMLTRISEQYGSNQLRSIKARTLLTWHKAWGSGGKIAIAGELIARLRALFRFGFTILEDRDCYRLLELLGEMRFRSLGPRFVQLTAEHVRAIRVAARDYFALPSIALAQALQFELQLSQKDVIGEWLPVGEPGNSQFVHRGRKWSRGLQWSSIDKNLILRHRAGSSGKPIEVDLRTAPMVLEELKSRYEGTSYEGTVYIGEPNCPIIVCEYTGAPWSTSEFRRKWRLIAQKAGVPDAIKNRDSVSSGIIVRGQDRARVSGLRTLRC
jgi:hypothetical protein